MKQIYLLCMSIFLVGTLNAQSDITFSVDLSSETFTTAYVSGNFNGWSGTADALTDMGGGIYEITLNLADGEYEYKFTYDDWAGQENFTQGDVCTITNYGNHNRRLVVEGADQTLPTPVFGTCAESTVNPGPHMVTLNVDMSNYNDSTLGTVYVNGENFNNQGLGAWCGACLPLTDQGNGIWSATLTLEEYAYQFKFTVDGWTYQEQFSPGDIKTATDGTYTNRYIQVDEDKTLDFVWNDSQQTLDLVEPSSATSLVAYPNPTTNQWNIKANKAIQNVTIYSILGKMVYTKNTAMQQVEVDASNLATGIYFAKVKTKAGVKTLKLVKQ